MVGAPLEGIFSFVTRSASSQPHGAPRPLPTLYARTNPIYADRSVDKVIERLEDLILTARLSATQSFYAMHACRINGKFGIYAKDFFNRSRFRSVLKRLGMQFADDYYVRLMPDGRFSSRDWGTFETEYVVAPGDPEQRAEKLWNASVPFVLAGFRMGLPDPKEFSRLVSVLQQTSIWMAKDPQTLFERLSA